MAQRPVIGLAGGIGSGKSTVADELERLGCVVSRSDELGRAALRDPEIRGRLVHWWGKDILDESGEVDRGKVAAIVFDDQRERERLEALVHPWIEARRQACFERAPADAAALVIDAPLLFEAGLDRVCDVVLFVDAERSVRLRRVAESRGWGEAELTRREESQMPLDAKRSRADYVVQNDGAREELVERVRRILNEIIRIIEPPRDDPSGRSLHLSATQRAQEGSTPKPKRDPKRESGRESCRSKTDDAG